VTNTMQQGSLRMRLRPACAGLTLVVMLGLAMVTTQSTQAQTFNALHNFSGPPDGANPEAPFLRGDAGTVYATTYHGGTFGYGTIFEVSYGIGTVLHSFALPDGASPTAGLVRDGKGNLYGTAIEGGSSGYGTVFKLDTSGTFTVLYNFTGGSSDGQSPYGGVILDKSGNLYGTTYAGGGTGCSGGAGCGTVFKLDKNGKETLLHQFTGGSDGGAPYYSGLLMDSTGHLYGVTHFGGTSNAGVVYKMSKSGKETVLYHFAGGTTDGCNPLGNVVIDRAGSLYGTTSACGTSNAGVVYKLSKSGQESVLYNFTGGADGGSPYAGVVSDNAGNFYGVTEFGGDFNCNAQFGCGTVFKLSSGGAFTVLHSFSGSSDGENPVGAVLWDSSGSISGTAALGGAFGFGTAWKLTP
jgi:uncharacterized repeat protein (TIGR03803 family)